MRAVGTGKHPEGRFPEGQVCDLPEWPVGSGKVHPNYQSLLDDGYLDYVAEEDDPGRTPTQIANAIVRNDLLSHPVDAALADEMTTEKAYAVTHTGDPNADEVQADPHEVRGSTVGHRGTQIEAAPFGVQPWADYDEVAPRAARRATKKTRTAAKKTKTTGARRKRRGASRSARARGRATGTTAVQPPVPEPDAGE